MKHLFLVEVEAPTEKEAVEHMKHIDWLHPQTNSGITEITLVDHIDQIPVRRGVSTEVPPQYKHPE